MDGVSMEKPLIDRARFARARAEAGLSQEELARLVGCSVFSIAGYERGKRHPRGPRLRKIAEVTGKPLSWFFEGVA
jgi:transcriptional regulator with XRE-family HTH domain